MSGKTWRINLTFTLALAVCAGCKSTRSDADAIRAGINQHLVSLKTLDLSAMQLSIDNVSYQGNQARAQVTFRPKSGAPPGAGMQVTYLLEKSDSGWSVIKTEGVGGGISHPAEGANPHAQSGDASGVSKMPNFRDLVPVVPPKTGGTLPPGHPPIDAQPKANDTRSDPPKTDP